MTLAATAVLGSSASDAEASGYLTTRFGGDHGTPAMANTYAIYFNPAALGGTKGTTLTGDVSMVLRYAHYFRTADALSPSANESDRLLADPNYVGGNTGNANLLNLLALPFLGVNTDFGGSKVLRGGFAAYIPFGGMATWDRDRGVPGAPGSEDGPQRWHNISGQILAIHGTFAGAVIIPGTGLSLGLNVSPVVQRVETVRARTADDSDDSTFANGSLKEGRSYLQATGFNFGGAAGVYWQDRTERFRAGLSYIAQPGFGQSRLNGTLDGRAAGGNDIKQNIDFLQTWPDLLRLGFAWRLPGDKWEIRQDTEFVRWSTFDKQCVVLEGKNCDTNPDGSATNPGDIVINIPRNWRNAWGYRAGVAHFLNETTELFASAAFTTSAVPKETIDASTVDSFRLYGSVGARFVLSDHVALAGSYNHIYFLPVDTEGRNRLNEFRLPSRSPSGDGRYTSQMGLFNVNVAYTF